MDATLEQRDWALKELADTKEKYLNCQAELSRVRRERDTLKELLEEFTGKAKNAVKDVEQRPKATRPPPNPYKVGDLIQDKDKDPLKGEVVKVKGQWIWVQFWGRGLSEGKLVTSKSRHEMWTPRVRGGRS